MIKNIVIVMALLYSGTLGQNINVTGTVTNASSGAPLQGVVVTLKSNPGLIDTTKPDGTYRLSGTVGVVHRLSGAETFPANRFNNGLLNIIVTQQEPVVVETYGLNGVLRGRLINNILEPGHYTIDTRGSRSTANFTLVKVRQGDETTVYSCIPLKLSCANGTSPDNQYVGLSKSEAFDDTLLFMLRGFTTAKMAITAPAGVNDNIALLPLTVTDIDGNIYHTVIIGTQVWMVENLRTTRCNNGDSITQVTDNDAWINIPGPGYCWYDNDSVNKNPFGALYNWYGATMNNLAPKGWHVPSDSEWEVLFSTLGGDSVAGAALRSSDTGYWLSYNGPSGTNTSGFSALPGGYRFVDDTVSWYDFGNAGYWWSTTQYDSQRSWYQMMTPSVKLIVRTYCSDLCGMCVRCVMDN